MAFVQILLNVNLFLNQTLLIFLLYVRQTMNDSIVSGNFSLRGYLSYGRILLLICMVCSYVKDSLRILTYVFDWLNSTQWLTSFSIDYLLHLYARFLILFHLTKMRFCRSTHLLMCVCLQTLTFIIRTGNLFQLQLVTFLLASLNVTLTVLQFLSSDASIYSTMAFPPLGNSDHVFVSVSVKFKTGCLV